MNSSSSAGYSVSDIVHVSDSSDNDISSDGYTTQEQDHDDYGSARVHHSSESDVEYQQRSTFDTGTDDNDSLSEQECQEPPAKKAKLPINIYSNASHRMMQKWGFNPEKGLGVEGQGRLEPVKAFENVGRRGLGMKTDKLDAAGDEFDPTKEVVQLRENVEWLINSETNLDELSLDDMEAWLKVGQKKMIIDDETKFCEPQVVMDVLKSKSVFDDKESDEKMRKARARSNPFEMIGRGIFQNRAAMKMANMDARLEFMFTNPVDEFGAPLVREDDLLYFADVCAGPGGFSEYVLWRKRWHSKGFGFTLRAQNDFKLDEFFAGHPETFDAYYGIKGDGDVYNPDNIQSLQNYVLSQTGTGVHFMMADGGFSVEKQENIQEILSKQLYLCQCLVALSIVREKGHFVCKLFDLFTPFSVGLIYLMYKCFQEICIFKPNTSRPANSERYLVCKWKLANTRTVERYLFDINSAMFKNKNSNTDTLEIVSHEVLTGDEKFFTYIYENNNRLGRNQVVNLLKIASYLKDKDLSESRQSTICSDCMNIWRVPHETRKKENKTTEQLFISLLGPWVNEKDFLIAIDRPLSGSVDLNNIFHNVTDWYFVPIETLEPENRNVRTFFMSKGRFDVFMYTPNKTWASVPNMSIEMTPNTLIYGEIVSELRDEGRMQKKTYGLHIIDGVVLGGLDIRNFRLTKRLELCQKFARALNKPNRSHSQEAIAHSYVSISCKKLYPLREFRQFFDKLSYRLLKNNKRRLGQNIRNFYKPEDRFYVPRGLLFFNELKPNLTRGFSKTHKKTYFYDTKNNKSFFLQELDKPDVIYASFKTTFTHRFLWSWDLFTQVEEEPNEKESNLLYRGDFNRFLDEHLIESEGRYYNQ